MDFNAVFTDRFRNVRHMWEYKLYPPHLINVATLLCDSQNTENMALQRDITKENCIRCIIASSKWTMVIMCLKFTYLGCYTAKRVRNKDSWVTSTTRENAWCKLVLTLTRTSSMLAWHLRSCVYAGGGHFECMLWPECSFIWLFTRTFYETVNVMWCT